MKKMLLTAIFAVMATAGSFAQRTPHAIGVHFGGSTMDFEYQYHFNKKNFHKKYCIPNLFIGDGNGIRPNVYGVLYKYQWMHPKR